MSAVETALRSEEAITLLLSQFITLVYFYYYLSYFLVILNPLQWLLCGFIAALAESSLRSSSVDLLCVKRDSNIDNVQILFIHFIEYSY